VVEMRTMIATVTSKGQVTVPAEARRRLGITAGTQLEFIVTEDGRLEIIPRVGSLRNLKGMLARPGRALSIEEMDATLGDRAHR
jgi:AbrB family looped-hinge helix DNA binding protein